MATKKETEAAATEASEARDQLDALESLNMAQLRTTAKLMKITSQKDWTAEDFIKAIQAKQQASVMEMVFDPTLQPKPGFARILLHRDPTPGSKNSPVQTGFNGQIYSIPRGIEVDIPKEFVEVLKNARTVTYASEGATSSDGAPAQSREQVNQSYPFQVLMVTPGEWKNPNDNRAIQYAVREEFVKMFGHWPTAGELKEAQKAKLIKAHNAL
jgi:hypothetical protein